MYLIINKEISLKQARRKPASSNTISITKISQLLSPDILLKYKTCSFNLQSYEHITYKSITYNKICYNNRIPHFWVKAIYVRIRDNLQFAVISCVIASITCCFELTWLWFYDEWWHSCVSRNMIDKRSKTKLRISQLLRLLLIWFYLAHEIIFSSSCSRLY